MGKGEMSGPGEEVVVPGAAPSVDENFGALRTMMKSQFAGWTDAQRLKADAEKTAGAKFQQQATTLLEDANKKLAEALVTAAAAGMKLGQDEGERKTKELNKLWSELIGGLRQAFLNQHKDEIVNCAKGLAEDVLKRSLTDPDEFHRYFETWGATELRETATLRVNPELAENIRQAQSQFEVLQGVKVSSDPQLSPGDFSLELDGADYWRTTLKAKLDYAALNRAQRETS